MDTQIVIYVETNRVFTWENSHLRDFHTRMTSWFCIMFTWWLGHFISCLYDGTLHVDNIHVWFKILNITHALLTPVYLQTDFTPKWVVILHLHDTVVKFWTGVKFLFLYNNWGELTPVWLVPAWHFVVVSCKQIQSHEREPVNTPWVSTYPPIFRGCFKVARYSAVKPKIER